MPVPVVCPECAKRLKAPDKARGKALKCPSCGGRVPVPADGAEAAAERPVRKKRRRPEPVAASGGTGEFIAGLDLSRAEDRETVVCPRCGTVIPEDENGVEPEECPDCGADLLTGGKGRTARRKAKFKDRGEDPRVFYSTAAGNAWTFLTKNVGVAVRLSVLTLLASLVASACWLAVAYCTYLPPKLFWGLPAVVGTLFVPGCLWVLQEAVTELTFSGKGKFKRFRFDFLDCVAKAPRIVVWAAVVLWPFTLLEVIAGLAWAAFGLTPWILIGVVAMHAVAAFLCWPAGLGHMAMPVSGPGWNMLTVVSGTAKNIGPVLFWAALTFAAFLPFLGVLGGVAALTGGRVADALAAMDANAAVYVAADLEAEEAGRELSPPDESLFTEIDWNAFLLPGLALIPLAFLFGFAAVYAARPAGVLAKMFRPSLGLITIAKERKYVPKLKRKNELDDLDEEPAGLTWGTVGAILGVTVLIGAIGGLVWSTLQESPMIATIGMGVLCVSAFVSQGAQLGILITAFKESVGFGFLVLFVPGAILWYIVTRWHETKHQFVLMMGCALLAVVGVTMFLAGAIAAAPPPI